MTEPQFEAPTIDAPASNGERRGRGRPRARETIERDEAVLSALREGPLTREQLAERLGQPSSLVYLALWRLAHLDPPKVVRTTEHESRHAWQLA